MLATLREKAVEVRRGHHQLGELLHGAGRVFVVGEVEPLLLPQLDKALGHGIEFGRERGLHTL